MRYCGKLAFVGAAAALGLFSRVPASAAQESRTPPWLPKLLGFQLTVIGQWLPSFSSPYSGPNSLVATGDHAVSHTYGIYFGSRILRGLGAYLDFEMAKGNGISRVTGLGGPTNGDVIRQGSADLGTGPYVARGFLRYSIRFGSDSTHLTRQQDQVPGWTGTRRLEIIAGKLAASDLFDLNRYANGTRVQFLNWGLFQNTAWDFAADTRGYTNGLALGYVAPRWALRAGSFQMPRVANGNVFDGDLGRARGDTSSSPCFRIPPGPSFDSWRTRTTLGWGTTARQSPRRLPAPRPTSSRTIVQGEPNTASA